LRIGVIVPVPTPIPITPLPPTRFSLLWVLLLLRHRFQIKTPGIALGIQKLLGTSKVIAEEATRTHFKPASAIDFLRFSLSGLHRLHPAKHKHLSCCATQELCPSSHNHLCSLGKGPHGH
jgi:hypothetical protein